MKSKKEFKELSEEELENVNGGIFSAFGINCEAPLHGCSVGEIYKYVDGKCQCVPMPNTVRRAR